MHLLLASRNPKKCEELLTLLAPLGFTVHSMAGRPDLPDVEETGETFEANATLKAESIARAAGVLTLADDSGLVVDALGGAPGVRSARFAGEAAGDAANNALLLERLASVPDPARTARFVCVIALAGPGAPTRLCRGETYGRILRAPRGANGFGYDPLFLSDDLGVTFAEADSARKHTVSHRGRALRQLTAYCEDLARTGR